MKKYLLIFALFILYSGSLHAECGVNNDASYCVSYIQVMRLFNSEHRFVRPSDDIGAVALNCEPRVVNSDVLLRNTHPLFKEIYTLLLAAQMTNTKVRLNLVADDAGLCDIDSAVLTVQPPPGP